ncbi:hypothetical protein [Natronobacterium haloterrestre]|uniref:hypothetical protein n=1 Tax=Natronobacterium haloterrestre TaxID=148448 RepID=UPI000B7F84CD|nr:hypothetical protein [Halobiforma haloterrestris]
MTEFECRECGETTPFIDDGFYLNDGVVSDGQFVECRHCNSEYFVYLHDMDSVPRNLIEQQRTVSYLFIQARDEGLLAVPEEDEERIESLLQFLNRLRVEPFEDDD